MTSRVMVVTDSAASLPEALIKRWDIAVVPLEVTIDDVVYREATDRDSDRVLDALEAGRKVSTSQPSVGAFEGVYRALAERGADRIVSIHISGKISGTVNGARLAAASSPVPVLVVDTGSVGMGAGWPALAAAAKAKNGASADEVAQEARRVAASASMLLTVDSLEYLRRGGRVPGTIALLGDALNVRPVLGVSEGEIVVLERVRTTPRARAAVVARAEAAIAELPNPGLAIMSLRAQAFADDATAVLELKYPHLAKLVRTPVTSVLAVHGGPGSFAAAVADLPIELR
ncbi:MAG TPA: DegV family protein [Demequinaceae bacterium]